MFLIFSLYLSLFPCLFVSQATITKDNNQLRGLTLQLLREEQVKAKNKIEKLQNVKAYPDDQLLVGFHLEKMVEVMTQTQKVTGIKNTTVAFLKVLEICRKWIEDQTQEEPEE